MSSGRRFLDLDEDSLKCDLFSATILESPVDINTQKLSLALSGDIFNLTQSPHHKPSPSKHSHFKEGNCNVTNNQVFNANNASLAISKEPLNVTEVEEQEETSPDCWNKYRNVTFKQTQENEIFCSRKQEDCSAQLVLSAPNATEAQHTMPDSANNGQGKSGLNTELQLINNTSQAKACNGGEGEQRLAFIPYNIPSPSQGGSVCCTKTNSSNNYGSFPVSCLEQCSHFSVRGNETHGVKDPLVEGEGHSAGDELITNVINKTANNGDNLGECSMDSFSGDNSTREVTEKHKDQGTEGSLEEGEEGVSTCWHSHPTGRCSYHSNHYSHSIIDSPQKPHNYKELLSQQVPPDNDICEEAGGIFFAGNTTLTANEGCKYDDQSSSSLQNIGHNDWSFSPEYENMSRSDNFENLTSLVNDQEIEEYSEIQTSSTDSYFHTNRQFETLQLDSYAPSGLANFDLFGDPPFGHGDPFAVQSPDPFDDDPFQLHLEVSKQPLGFFAHDSGFLSPLISSASGSLYKIVEEAEEIYTMDKSKDESVQDKCDSANNSDHLQAEPLLIDFRSPDVNEKDFDKAITGETFGIPMPSDDLRQGESFSKSMDLVNVNDQVERETDCDIVNIYDKIMIQIAKDLVDMVLAQALDEIAEKTPLQKRVTFSDASDCVSNPAETVHNGIELLCSNEVGGESSMSGICEAMSLCNHQDFTLDPCGDVNTTTEMIYTAENDAQNGFHTKSSCTLPDKEGVVSDRIEDLCREEIDIAPTWIPQGTGEVNSISNGSILKFAKQIVSRVLIGSLKEVELYYTSKHSNCHIQRESAPQQAHCENGNNTTTQVPHTQAIDNSSPAPNRPDFFHSAAFSVSIEVEECSSPEGSCGCIPPPQIRIHECATPMGSESGDFYAMVNGLENAEDRLDDFDDNTEPDFEKEEADANEVSVVNHSYSADIDMDQASVSDIDNDQVSSLDENNGDSDNDASLSDIQSEEQQSPGTEQFVISSRKVHKRYARSQSTTNNAERSRADKVRFQGFSLDCADPPCVQIHECSSPDSSPDEWHEVYAKSQACSVPQISIQGCSSREPSSDEEGGGRDENAARRKKVVSKKAGGGGGGHHVDTEAVAEFVDQLITEALDAVQGSSMGTEKESSVHRVDRLSKQTDVQHRPNSSEEDSYSEEIKQLHDQIPEELSIPIGSLPSRGVSQSGHSECDPQQANTVPSVNSTHKSHSSPSPNYQSQPQQATAGSQHHYEEEEEDFIDNNHVHDMSGINGAIQRELSLAEELSQSMHEELHNIDLDLTEVGDSLESPRVKRERREECDGEPQSQAEPLGESESMSANGSESVYDRLIDRVLTGCSKKKEVKPEITSNPGNACDSQKRKILPTLELLSPEDELEPRPESRHSCSSDTDYSVYSRTPDDTTGEVHRLPSCGSDRVGPSKYIPEYSAREEFENNRNWRSVDIGGKTHKIDMRVIEPYKKVLSHGGYYGDGFNAIIVFAACHLPDKRRRDYQYVMDNLFLYVVSTLELLVVEDYMIVYFHGATPKNKMPGLRWLKQCYEMIDRKLKKNLKKLLIVHPTLWLKTVVVMTKPFVSSKFYNKIEYVKSLCQLTQLVPTEYIFVPDEIQQYDASKNKSDYPPENYTEL